MFLSVITSELSNIVGESGYSKIGITYSDLTMSVTVDIAVLNIFEI
jgi:hypothetical protein